MKWTNGIQNPQNYKLIAKKKIRLIFIEILRNSVPGNNIQIEVLIDLTTFAIELHIPLT